MPECTGFSICVPAFNEQKSLSDSAEDLIKVLSPRIKMLEIIIVNDGSTDSTGQIAERITKEYPQVRTIHHKKRSGIGVCYRDALAVAQGSHFSWFPADHENSAEEFVQCLPHFRKNTIVTCYHSGQDPRSFARKFISQSYTRILNKLFKLDLKYYNGLTVFPVPVLHSFSLFADGFLFSSEIIIKASRRGFKVVEISFPLKKRVYGKSAALTLSSFIQMAKDIFHILGKEH